MPCRKKGKKRRSRRRSELSFIVKDTTKAVSDMVKLTATVGVAMFTVNTLAEIVRR